MQFWRGFDCPATFCYVSMVFTLSKLCERLIRPGRLHRGIAIFFPIFTFTDLVIADTLAPELCTESVVGLLISVENTVGSETHPSKDVLRPAATDNRPCQDQPAHPEGSEEDCFCCCSHIISGVYIDVAVLNEMPRLGGPANVIIPTSPPRGTYHPPRLS
jgi:hypothetical protein